MNKKENKRKKNDNIRYLIILIIITIILLIWAIYLYIKNNDNSDDYIKKNITIEKEIEVEESKEVKKEKSINEFKKNIIAKWLIVKWDIHLEHDDYLFALQKFSKANKQTPNNPKILSKIAEAYFLMKNYSSAHKYYIKINDSDYLDQNKMILSLIYKEKLESEDFKRNIDWDLVSSWTILKIKKIKENIKNISMEEDNKFYYLNSLECLNNFHNCKVNFEEYFKKEDYSWKNENLEKIRIAISNYKNLKLEEIYYKNTLIIWALFENKNYPVAIILSSEILEKRKNYKPVLKILAQSYFELNKLKLANKFLIEYAKIDSKSPDVYYMIWVISQKNHDYIKSNIFLNLALEQNYKNIENIYRLQLYNYLILSENKKISKTFDKIIELNQKPNSNDLILATYYNIISNDIDKATILTEKWLELYPEKEDFYWFKAWIKIEKNELDDAEKLLNKAREINGRNALVILNLWRISKIKYERDKKSFDKVKAKFLFKKAIEFDSAEIWELAKKYLNEIETKEDQEKRDQEKIKKLEIENK